MAISGIIFACVFSAAMLGMLLRRVLPPHHLDPDSKDVVKLGMALIATMSALVLGLLIASAKGSFDAQRSELTQMSANIIQLDRTPSRYGPESKEARGVVRRAALSLDRNWAGEASSLKSWTPLRQGRQAQVSMKRFKDSRRATTSSARFRVKHCR